MAKGKADLQRDWDRYHCHLEESRSAIAAGNYCAAIAAAEACWDHVDGMMQFARKYKGKDSPSKEHGSIEAIDIVLNLAPLVFEQSSLAKLADLLKSQRRIDRNSTDDFRAKHAAADQRMWLLHKLWTLLEETDYESDELKAKLGIDAKSWDEIVVSWESIGLLSHDERRVRLATRMQAPCFGKCPQCGVVVKGVKSKLLQELNCPKCRTPVHFVLVTKQTS